jgi:Ankyrin repeats (3 copies)
LAVACEVGDDATAKALLAAAPDLASTMAADDVAALPRAAERNATEVVRRMLAAGWPSTARGTFGATALHWAAWHGNRAMAAEILRYRPDLEASDLEYGGTPLGWALHGSLNGWHCRAGDYGGTVEALLNAGAKAVAVTPGLEASQPALDALRRHAGRQ